MSSKVSAGAGYIEPFVAIVVTASGVMLVPNAIVATAGGVALVTGANGTACCTLNPLEELEQVKHFHEG